MAIQANGYEYLGEPSFVLLAFLIGWASSFFGGTMDKATLISIVARNGLDTAQIVFINKSVEAEAKAATETDSVKRSKLIKDAKQWRKLVAALSAAEKALAEYLKETVGI